MPRILKIVFAVLGLAFALFLIFGPTVAQSNPVVDGIVVHNATICDYPFLAAMYADSYFPRNLVAQGEKILRELCVQIEAEPPPDLPALYKLTQQATSRFNRLGILFMAVGSEIETVARETIATDLKFIADTYGYPSADLETLIANRTW